MTILNQRGNMKTLTAVIIVMSIGILAFVQNTEASAVMIDSNWTGINSINGLFYDAYIYGGGNIDSQLQQIGVNKTIYLGNGTYIATDIKKGQKITCLNSENTIIQSTNILTTDVIFQSRSQIENCGYQGAYVYDPVQGYAGALRQVGLYANMRESNTTATFYPHQFMLVDTAESVIDRPQIGCNQFGVGDCFWAGVINGVGLRAHTTGAGTGIVVGVFSTGNGQWLITKQNGSGLALLLSSENGSAVLSKTDHTNLSVPARTADFHQVTTDNMTSGSFENWYQSNSNYSGTALNMNFGVNNIFSGNFYSFYKNGTLLSNVDSNGLGYFTRSVTINSDTVAINPCSLISYNGTNKACYGYDVSAGRAGIYNYTSATWTHIDNGTADRTIKFSINNGSNAFSTGTKPDGDVEIPCTGNIVQATALVDQAGSGNISWWVDSYANFPPTSADEIGKINTSGAISSQLTGLSQAVTAGQILRFNVNFNDVVTKEALNLKLRCS